MHLEINTTFFLTRHQIDTEKEHSLLKLFIKLMLFANQNRIQKKLSKINTTQVLYNKKQMPADRKLKAILEIKQDAGISVWINGRTEDLQESQQKCCNSVVQDYLKLSMVNHLAAELQVQT